MGVALKCHIFQDSQVGIPKIGIPFTLEAHNFLCIPPIKVMYEKNYNPCQKLSNDMWHATYTDINQGDS
jgi:hypothetical protein